MRPTIWLMERFGVAHELIGDLAEASARHRAAWLWWEATAAIAAALAKDIVGHPVLALRATLVGMAALMLFRTPTEWLWYQVDMTAMYRLGLGFLGLEHRYALASGIVRTILWTPSWLVTGWLMIRVQRARTPVMVLPLLALTWSRDFPEFWRLLSNALDQARFRPYLAVNLVGLIVFNLSIIVGAAWQRHEAPATSHRKTGPSLVSQ